MSGIAIALLAATLSFDGGDVAPVKSENVTFVKGMSGRAVHLGKDSFLEYAANAPDFMTPTSGTFMVWFRHDYTFPTCCRWRDRDRAENGDVSWFIHSGVGERMLFRSGSVAVGGGISGGGTFWGRRVLGGEWHFLAMSYDVEAGKSILHADGLTLKEVAIPKGRWKLLGRTFTLGCGGGKLGLEGSIDEVCFMPCMLDEKAMCEEYLKWQPVRYELLDWSVGKGETKAFRFRARNESAKKVEKTLRFSNGVIVALSLAPDEVKEFTVEVKGGKPGLFTLWLNEGEPDARQFECICLANNLTQSPQRSSKEETSRTSRETKTLIGEYDCTKEYPRDRMALCASEVVTNGALRYLESRDYRTSIPLAACRFKIRHQGLPHIVELDYPDDKARSFIFGVYPEKWARLYTKTIDCAGVMTGVDYPLSGEMQTKSLVFWPDSDSVSVVVQNYKGDRGLSPAACASVRIYELDGLPPGPVQGMSKNMRSVAEWDEDPTIDAALMFSQAFNYDRADLEFWRIKWQRVIDYMRWNSMDSWVIKVVNYNGDATAMDATMPEAALPWDNTLGHDGRCRGWAELGADMLSRAGMGFWVRINHRDWKGWFTRLGGGDPGEKGKPLDLRNPAVRKAYLRLVAAYRDKFGRYSGFRGVTLNEHMQVYYPGGQKEMEDFARELGATIRANGGDAEVQIWVSAACSFGGGAKWGDWDAAKQLNAAGVDLARLAKIPGVRPVMCVRPDFYRARIAQFADRDEPYFPDSPSWVQFLRECDINCINVFRHSNFELYPTHGYWEAAANPWKTELWLPTYNIVTWAKDFQSYATPHARPPYTLDSVASFFADCDIQDFLTGWWGIMESGEHDEWRRFYGQFRKIPRGHYALVKGPDDPVAVRSGAEGHYLVNREPYPVKVEYVVDGKPETIILRQHEIRFVKGRGANGAVEVKIAKIPTAEKATHLANLEKLEAAAKADAKNAALVRAAKEARAAFDKGRFHQFRVLFHLGVVRKVFHPEVFPNK